MTSVAGVDVGNSTTEVCIAQVGDTFKILGYGEAQTTGAKGSPDNITGIMDALNAALSNINEAGKTNDMSNANKPDIKIELIRLNDAAPVISGAAMDTISDTVITGSAMLGHNPDTPGGAGIGVGITVDISKLEQLSPAIGTAYGTLSNTNTEYIVIAPGHVGYSEVAAKINAAILRGIAISGVILEANEGVLVSNRIKCGGRIPVIDEVAGISLLPEGVTAAVEVAEQGYGVKTLSNPYGIATLFKLSADETRMVLPIAKSLSGKRSGVVFDNKGEMAQCIINAGKLYIKTENNEYTIEVSEGADNIMRIINSDENIICISGEDGARTGNMLNSVKMDSGTVTDLLAVDITSPVKVSGGLTGESFPEKAVAVAAMARTHPHNMRLLGDMLCKRTGAPVEIGGAEAVMAAIGALSTPGVGLPMALLDMGGGSVDAAIVDRDGAVRSVNMAGAGEMVSLIIDSELGLDDRILAEAIKKYPVGKVESLFSIRIENGRTLFYEKPIDPKFFGRVVLLTGNGLIAVEKVCSNPGSGCDNIERVAQVRRAAKSAVFVQNALRALTKIAPGGNIRNIPNIVLAGGSALDFEIPEMLLSEFAKYGIVCGRANVLSRYGARCAVAAGLTLACGV